MADVTLIATRDFSYATRRLKAGDTFTVNERMAKVLVGIKKAEQPRIVGSVPAPPASLVKKVVASSDKPKPKRRRKSPAKKG